MDNIITLYKHAAPSSSSSAPSSSTPFVSLQGHKGYISSLSFFDGGKLFSSSGDSCSMIWDVEKQIASHVFKGSTGQGA
jgi:WD40 repeat protein